MTHDNSTVWDSESLQQLRLIRDRPYRRRLGTLSLLALAALAAYGGWFADFRAHTLWYFFGYWAVVFVALMATVFFALVDFWAIRLEFALQRRELAKEIVATTRQTMHARTNDAAEHGS